MTDRQHEPTPDAAHPTTYCTTKPRAGDHLTDACRDCGHAVVLHVGTDHCPVCELLDLNAQARGGGRVEVRYEAPPLGKVVAELERQMVQRGLCNPLTYKR
jgi:hypothetical protein